MVSLFLEFMTQCPCTHVVHLRCIPHFILFHGFVGRQVLSCVGNGGGLLIWCSWHDDLLSGNTKQPRRKRDCNAAIDIVRVMEGRNVSID